MQTKNYKLAVTVTIATYVFSTVYDFVTSMLCMARGYVEVNPIFSFIGYHYFVVYWALSIILPVILLEFGNRWAFLCLNITTAIHLACILNNSLLLAV